MNPDSQTRTGGPYNGICRFIPIQTWEEDDFNLVVRERPPSFPCPLIDLWEIEAVGAADDPARFRLDWTAWEDVALDVHF